jgi:hypothetical protein
MAKESGKPASNVREVMDARKPSSRSSSIQINGVTFQLKFNYDALASLEDLYDMSIQEVGDLLSKRKPRLRDVQRILYAGLRDNHAEITYEGVAMLLNEAIDAGVSMNEIMTDTFSAMNNAQPDKNEDDKAGDEERPPA